MGATKRVTELLLLDKNRLWSYNGNNLRVGDLLRGEVEYLDG